MLPSFFLLNLFRACAHELREVGMMRSQRQSFGILLFSHTGDAARGRRHTTSSTVPPASASAWSSI